jgi:rhodanese-related sulfurtransferase
MFSCSTAIAGQINLHIDTQSADDHIQQNADNADFYLIDVRTAEEFKAGHLANASYIDFYQKDFISQLEKLDKDKTYLLYCRTGRRSANALEMMKKLGFNEAYNMKGGITQWLKEGRPIVVPK